MRIISTYLGHESNITLWEDGKITTLELDKISGEKWIAGNKIPYAELATHIGEALELTGGNKFDLWINGSFANNEFNGQIWHQRFMRIIDAKRVIHGPGHHLCHAYSSFFQSPFDKALVISSDGGGNDGTFHTYRADKQTGISLFEDIPRFDFGTCYGMFGTLSPELNESHHWLNVAGKAMGLAPFYTPPDPLTELDRNLRDKISATYSGNGYKWVTTQGLMERGWNNRNIAVQKHGKMETMDDVLAARRILYWSQYTLNEKMKAILVDRTYELFSRYDGNLVLTGGTAMNVTTNEFIKNEGINTFVPCNPTDRGLSLGSLYWYLYMTGMDIPEGSQHFSGIPLIQDAFPEPKKRKASIKSIAKLLKEGAIIGVAEGNNEVGQRALGRRSIIADPSLPGIKDKINEQVKFREMFRPFAPVVLEEHLHYFKTVSTDNLEFMGYAIQANDEFKEKFPDVVHVDGTSRVQLCTDTNSTVYKLMKELGTPLLNTSFNIQGQPIIARESEAFIMLEEGGLDAILLNGVLYKKPGI